MDKETLAYFNDTLITRLKEIFRATREGLSIMARIESSQDPMDEVDQTSKRYDQEFMLHLHYRNEQLIQEILDALRRVKNGDFGTCSGCGTKIELKRLKAHPMATLCINCKKATESMQRCMVA